MSTDIVAVDIGGTHVRFAIANVAKDGRVILGEPVTMKTGAHNNFQRAWQSFKGRNGGSLPDAASFAVAGPVGGEVVQFTNVGWTLQPRRMSELLGTKLHTIVNDFEAIAHTVARAEDDQFLHLTGPELPLPAWGTISIIGPGTGLGVALLHRSGDGRYQVQATEGGHTDYAPLDPIEDAILARLRSRHSRVSVERIVSGPGIVDIYATLAAMDHQAVADLSDVEIWTAAANGSDVLALAAVDRFCRALGAVAGDCALAQGASGVVIAGGLGYRIRDIIKKSGFAGRFCAKGRFASLMAALPVKLIAHPQPGLFGAASAFAKEHLQ